MSRLTICDRCGVNMGDSFEMPRTRLSRHLNSSVRFFYEGDLCDNCIDEVVSFIKIKPDSDNSTSKTIEHVLGEVRHGTYTAASTLKAR